ncbi:MAG: VWA domain-containing protein [Planctomycetaceae bacterium]
MRRIVSITDTLLTTFATTFARVVRGTSSASVNGSVPNSVSPHAAAGDARIRTMPVSRPSRCPVVLCRSIAASGFRIALRAAAMLVLLVTQVRAQAPQSREVTQWDYHSPAQWDASDWLMVGGFLAAAGLVLLLYVRDTRGLTTTRKYLWCGWLAALRIAVIVALFVVFLDPHERTETQAYRPSQVLLLVDASASMEQPETDPRTAGGADVRSRAAAVEALLRDSPLIEELRQTHHVDLYTFDSDLSEPRHRFLTRFDPESGTGQPSSAADSPIENEPALTSDDWQAILRPTGQETRLGDSLDKLLATRKGKSLSGVVVVSDGANNSGRDWQAANQRARENSVRLVSVGVGSTTPPVNLQVARIIAPTDVQLGDPFEITAMLQSAGLIPSLPAGVEQLTVTAELLEQTADDPQPRVVDSADATFRVDGEPVPVVLERKPEKAGEIEYSVRVKAQALLESRDDDNLKGRRVNIFDRPLRVLMIASGPSRDYRFAKNALYRHKSIDVDVWLQTGSPGISQDADELLFAFPSSRDELFSYDVILAFDPDWSNSLGAGAAGGTGRTQWDREGSAAVSAADRTLLEEWVTEFGGGIVLVAGEVFTSRLAAIDTEREPEYAPIVNLYPVLLEEVALTIGRDRQAGKAYPVGLTQAGEAADFLQLTDDPSSSLQLWREFPGFFRSYPTRGRKGGATIYAEYSDPLSRGREGPPILLAGQRYGLGSSLFLGSPEVWRLRSFDEEYYDRFWVKLIRKAAEGRLKRGLERAVLLLEGRDYEIGQTVPLRARVVDASFKPLSDAAIEIEVTDPSGRPIIPAPRLQQDSNRPEEYFGTLRVAAPGRYQLKLTARR